MKNILALSREDRYGYFIRRVADFEILWGLYDAGWACLADNSGNSVLPFWPEAEFAALCATGSWNNYTPQSISLGEFLDKWLPGMAQDGTKVNIFLTPEEQPGLFLEPDLVLRDLKNEAEGLGWSE